uniref:palmitoyl-protein hydrolase n=1 Tax=Myxobolus squamalis TaxID=59785 RepID=A0A6B2G7G5_MYXSQ
MLDPKESKNGTLSSCSSMIFFHGLGGHGSEWYEKLSRLVPENTELICPTASFMNVTRYENEMRAWFDSHYEDRMDVGDPENLKKSSEYMLKLIEMEIQRGILPHKIVIGGFSQGGAVSFYTGVNCPHKIGGAVILSAWLPCYKELIENKARTF